MGIGRREFLRVLGGTSAALLPAGVSALASEPVCDPHFESTYGVLVDSSVCIGCRRCEHACDAQHELSDRTAAEYEDRSLLAQARRPSHDAFTVVNRIAGESSGHAESFIKLQCMHCNEPACVSACIVGALSKCTHGPVTYDAWKCIGCRYCMVACPFQIPAYEYHDPVAPRLRKCTFCAERIHHGDRPACVAACPAEALTFGKRGELLELARSKIKARPERYVDHIYGETEVGGTSWMYLASVDFVNSGLPQLAAEPIPKRTESIQHGIFKSFMPPIAFYGLLGLIMVSTRRDGRAEQTEEGER
jgi:Fe-S-cluster-containing dehydrogenase component